MAEVDGVIADRLALEVVLVQDGEFGLDEAGFVPAPSVQVVPGHALESGPFNKMRMCVFPKSYLSNENEPEVYP